MAARSNWIKFAQHVEYRINRRVDVFFALKKFQFCLLVRSLNEVCFSPAVIRKPVL